MKLFLPKQLVLCMKLTVVLLVAFCIQVSARGYSQGKINLSYKDAPLEKVLKDISKQSGYYLWMDPTLSEYKRPVSIRLTDVSLTEAMEASLKGTNLTYAITEARYLVVSKKKEEAVQNNAALGPGPAKVQLVGKITDEGGGSISAATIMVKGTRIIISANENGDFSLDGIDNDAVLIVSSVGYESFEIPLKGRSFLNVRLKRKFNQLDETLIIAYGTTSQRYTTGDIAKVSSQEIENQPIIDPLLALQGKVPGLDVNQTNGFASAPIKVELRGRSSIGLSNKTFPSDPLYVIDGVPLSIMELGGNSSYTSGSSGFLQNGDPGPAVGQSPFFSINPADIESIEILKDADATSIYGSRGANGVILVTTKKGRQGKTRFDMHVQDGFTAVTRFYKLLNTPQYLEMRREAFKNDGITPNAGNAYDLLSWDTTKYADWQRELYGHAGRAVDAECSLSGGNANTTFRIGAGYNNTTNILTVSGGDQRASASLSLMHRSIDQKFNLSLNSIYSSATSNMVSLPGSVIYPPDAPPIYDSAGNLNYNGWGGANTAARSAFPFAQLKEPYTAKTTFQSTNLTLGYRIYNGLHIVSSFGYNNSQNNQQTIYYIAAQDPLNNPTGSNNWGNNSNRNWIIEPRLTYENGIGTGKLSTLIGTTIQQTNTDGVDIIGTGYTSDNLIRSISNSTSIQSNQTSGEYRYVALYGRVNYIFDDKYIVDLNGRRDGSSRFGAGKQFGNFGSIGLGWIFSDEQWVKQNLGFLSFGKLKGSYGSTGSDAIPEFAYLTQWSSNSTYPYGGNASVVPTQLANSVFHWQVNKKLEAALDLGFLRDRISLQIAYYRDRCGDQLVSFPLPALNGFTSVVANSPALVQNSGLEFSSNLKIVDTRNFSWGLDFNIASNQNKLVSYPSFNLSPYVGKYVVGQPLNIVRLLHYTGVDPQTGVYTFYDKLHNGNIVINYNGTPDDTYIHNLSPKFFGGVGMNFRYKSLQAVLFFSYKKQIGVNAVYQGQYPGNIENQPTFVLNRWQKPGDIAPIAKYTTLYTQTNLYYQIFSDAAYTDASFLRLSNLAISYNLPGNYLKRVGMNSISLFIHANNLFVITGFKGIDPETQGFGAMPPAKTLVGGLSFEF
ncbi:SusC/RagA family TonB-linked outer membrane protein [Dinghuibacter silviterrae]|uniref:TonB-linked SusC/RagA family outer membrane protein n=1 Tax=Dinghuibacter silviterrae TaxID=1539049 RepID=A0A4R8DU07_9BACT|nr:SusC/RagA family TonB-linked outer membrane protein [Dinghuibacter silviterrae]TDX01824.1 TonB-linked SusC/RagA family outer membrane protein [Dinghuibacter silviterrae]